MTAPAQHAASAKRSKTARARFVLDLAFALFAAVSTIDALGDAIRQPSTLDTCCAVAWAFVAGAYLLAFALAYLRPAPVTDPTTGGTP